MVRGEPSRKAKNSSSANLSLEDKLWSAADKMRGHMDSAEYKHVALGLIFLKYISDAFQERDDQLAADQGIATSNSPKLSATTHSLDIGTAASSSYIILLSFCQTRATLPQT